MQGPFIPKPQKSGLPGMASGYLLPNLCRNPLEHWRVFLAKSVGIDVLPFIRQLFPAIVEACLLKNESASLKFVKTLILFLVSEEHDLDFVFSNFN